MAAKKKDEFLVVYRWEDGSNSVYESYQSADDAIDGAKECLNENSDDTEEAFVVVKTHRITRDYTVEKL